MYRPTSDRKLVVFPEKNAISKTTNKGGSIKLGEWEVRKKSSKQNHLKMSNSQLELSMKVMTNTRKLFQLV